MDHPYSVDPVLDGLEGVRTRLGSSIEIMPGPALLQLPGRYVCHTEDEPLLKSTRCDDIGQAMQHVYDHVAMRLNQNGCGDGLVFDRWTERIVAVFGHVDTITIGGQEVIVVGTKPMPTEAEQQRMRLLVEAWDRQERGVNPPFIWNTCGG